MSSAIVYIEVHTQLHSATRVKKGGKKGKKGEKNKEKTKKQKKTKKTKKGFVSVFVRLVPYIFKTDKN